MSFNKLGLSDELLSALQEKNYLKATPVQSKAIPYIIQGLDILAGAQTGTGKTAAFALPILNKLQKSKSKRRRVRALVLTPTRELASQVADSFRDYGSKLRFKTAVLYGGVSIKTQKDKLRMGVDIIVATPGRLLDHLSQKTVDLSEVEVFVLDEGDRMLDMGFIVDIKKIIKSLPYKRQNLLFSATFPREIRTLASKLLHSPKEIQISSQNSTAEKVKQIIYPVDRARKKELLIHCIKEEKWFRVLVFTKTKRGADKLTKVLNKQKINANAIHGDKTQAARSRALKSFKDGEIQVLVATDVAARGIDISLLPYVINFDLPLVPEDYIHRIGRTARAGKEGTAISLVCADDFNLLSGIERLLNFRIPREEIEGFETTQHLNTTNLKSNSNQKKNPYNKNKKLRKKVSDNKKSPWRKKKKSSSKNKKNTNQRKSSNNKRKSPFNKKNKSKKNAWRNKENAKIKNKRTD
ncbi:MAG: DEAD/DEAH box helicase [Gammaproteobacteria bacterium]|jgi:ATP-dependent RNA helicase RhlE|nr:DEAD/DEAH box helicase [Gammaproteobacteria bacterium]MBT5217578.1 DEAD/DEAH box helicase [Gammaproteobacteria bacterium]MBT5542115.1 DEAD/DEAH box helicase [Gammaproteobacteria bacterium]MBT7754181.1 DEAD/DEAH box helicase [Gammaproteobacteria bacterium]MDG2434056.1 DEAD/DEAH box helicase [Gammaproteobacteria bacterium]